MTSQQRRARLTGGLYLLLALFSGLPWLYLQTAIVEAGDAAATAGNVVANETLIRLCLVSELAGMTCYVLVGMAFYALLGHVDRNAAAAMVTFASVGAAIMGAALITEVAALTVATDGHFATIFGRDGSDALVMMFLDLRGDGYLVAQVFFGLWLLPLGYLTYRSGYFPRALGVLLVIGCFSHLADLVAQFLSPNLAQELSSFVLLPAVAAELWMVAYLLIRGVRVPSTTAAAA